MAWVRDEIRVQDSSAEVIGVFKPSLKARRPLRDVWRLPWLMATSAAIVLDDFYPLVYGIRVRPGTRLIQLWHAAGAFKQVGHSRAGLTGGPTPGSRIHRNYTDAYVSSESIRDDYAEAFGIAKSRVRALGVPRTDVFFDDAALASARGRVRGRLGVSDEERLVVFAPTFRGNGQLSAYADDTADWQQVATDLGPGWRVAVRLHPFTAAAAGPLPEGVLDGGDGVDMNDLLAATDVLVTDYSSAIFEFGLLDRPVVFFAPDLEAYLGSRAFYRAFEHYAIGPVVGDPADLAQAIRSASVDSAVRTPFREEFCSALDGQSAARIAADILGRETAPRPPRTVLKRLRLPLLAAYAARALIVATSLLTGPLRRRRKITLVTREHPRAPLDFVMLRDAIVREDPSVEVMMIARMVPPGVAAKFRYAAHLLVEMYHVATSRVLVVDGYSPIASLARHRPGLTIIQMWHALGALKKFGLSILGQDEGRDPRIARVMRMHENYDIVLASAERCRRPYAEAFGVTPDKVVIAPLPRVDYLRDPEARSRARARFLRDYPELADRRIALFAPTFRAHGTPPGIDPVELSVALEEAGYATITKLHPILPPPDHPALRTAPGMSTQDLLFIADVFITDYSSAIFEAAVSGVPAFVLAPDLDTYRHARDFYVDVRAELPGPISRTVAEVTRAVRDHSDGATVLQEFAATWVSAAPHAPMAGATNHSDVLARLVTAHIG